MLHRAVETSSAKQEHLTDPTLISQRMLCFPRGDARAKKLSLYEGFSHSATNTRLRQAATAAHRTDSDFPATAMLSQRFSAWHEPNFTAASSARLWSFCRVREEELWESWCLLGLAFLALCSRRGFTLPGRTKQAQPQPCSSVCSLGWHSMHTTISQCRHRLAFYFGPQADSRTR